MSLEGTRIRSQELANVVRASLYFDRTGYVVTESVADRGSESQNRDQVWPSNMSVR